ncbi:MAG: hypothetical protein M0Q49_07690 [Porticoccaceae bacterium]|nr:hypothetical protein [Porticoccaceae bacterium]
MTPLSRLARQRAFPWLAAVLSLLVSAWLIALDPVLDNDGVLYLVAAETFVAEGFLASVDIYQWPFLQLLIGSLHALTGLETVTAGLLIVSLCYALLAAAFVRTVKEMGGSPLTQLLAALIVVFHSQLGADRSSITRDAGMLAFMLLALVELIRYGKTGHWRHVGQWTLCVSAAFLFRVEVLSIALLSPLGLLLLGELPLRTRAVRLAKLLVLPCALLAGSVIALQALSPDLLESLKVAEDLGIFQRETLHFSQRLGRMAGQLAGSGLLRHTSVNDAAWGVAAVMAALFTLNLVRALTLPYALILLQQWRSKKLLHLCPVSDRLIKVHLGIIVIYQMAFIFFYQFSLGRYSLQIAILLLLYLPFVLSRWWQGASRPLTRILIVVLLCGYAIDALVNSRYKKAYIAEAAVWLRDTPLADGIDVVSNNHHIAYKSGRLQRDDILMSRLSAEFHQAHTPWRADTFYAYRTPRQTDLNKLRADIRQQGGKIHREFEGGDKRTIVMFSLPAK